MKANAKKAHRKAPATPRSAKKDTRSSRSQKSQERSTTAQQSDFLFGSMVDPFEDVFGRERGPDVAEYEVDFTRHGRQEEDAPPDFCTETLAHAIHEAKAWIADGRAEEYTITCADLPLLRVTTKGVEPIARHPEGESEVRKGIAELLVWEQIIKPLFVDGPVLVPEKSADDTSNDNEEDALDDDDDDESEES